MSQIKVKIRNAIKNPSRSLGSVKYRIRERWRCYTSQVNPHPILVFGNQKSGTSAVTALLGEATGLSYTIDIFCLYEDLEERLLKRETSLNELLDRARFYFSREIIKEPGLTFFYDDLRAHFPKSHQVFVLRNPYDNIRSILNRVNLPGNLEDLNDIHWQYIREKLPYWYVVFDGTFAGHKGNNYIETLALRCRQVFEIYLSCQTNVIPIWYESFKKNKVKIIHQLASELNLPIKHNIENIKDNQFQPKGNSSIDTETFFGSKNMERIRKICGEVALDVGYEI
ncbi:UNVERIFIED_CONTAM: hypothetical protein BEN50_17775 [Euhalothece sp. KZN 001]